MIQTNVVKARTDRIGINFVSDDTQFMIFLNYKEFMNLMMQMFDCRDANKEEIKNILNL